MAYKENVNPGLYGLLKNGAPAPPCSPAGAPQGPPHHGDPLRCPSCCREPPAGLPPCQQQDASLWSPTPCWPPVPAGRSQLRFQKSTGHGAWISSQGREDSAGRGQPTPAGAEAFLSRGHSPHSSPPASSAHSSDERCPPSPPLQKMLRVQPQRPRSQGRVCLHLWREHPRLRLHTPPKRVLKYDTPLRLLVLQLI
nr:basic salivary proline-rich protein 1-like isoform X3 [Anas platyrhynchos]